MSSFNESDEAFARRLQAQEMGTYSAPPIPDAQTPLMNRNNDNPTVINARLNELNQSRLSVVLMSFVNLPQIIAVISVLSIHWNDPLVCDLLHTNKWKWWAIISAIRMATYLSIMVYIHVQKTTVAAENQDQAAIVKAESFKHSVDMFALIWFIVGNMWLFGDDNHNCVHPRQSPIYLLSLSILLINYIQLFLPCIIALLLLPVFCLCMPCFIRVMARIQSTRANVGATDSMMEALPETVVTASDLRPGEDNTCPICLNEMAIGDAARSLRCGHIFHKQCVDEWLRVNASCPTCRKRIVDDDSQGSGGGATGTETTSTRSLMHNSNSTGSGRGDISMGPLRVSSGGGNSPIRISMTV